jgi:hypothetical protein
MTPRRFLKSETRQTLLQQLETRFHQHPERHAETRWSTVLDLLEAHPAKLWSLSRMEDTGGQPDVVDLGLSDGRIVFIDCSPESPAERRSLCYDHTALQSRRQAKPRSSAMSMAEDLGIELLSEEQYRRLQMLGHFDLKTSSWVNTPATIRQRGGALFCERRYDSVFVFHNGAESYFAARGFRGLLEL